jgi:hypothetical protein
MTLAVTHSTAADGTFSIAGATAWNDSHALAGVADVSQGGTGNATWSAGQILYASGTTTLTQSANLAWDITNSNLIVNGAPTGAATTDKLQVNGDANLQGFRIGFNGSTYGLAANTANAGITLNTINVTTGAGGNFGFTAGATTDIANNGGAMTFAAGGSNGVGTAGNGGGLTLAAGASAATGTGRGGTTTIRSGNGAFGGSINLLAGSSLVGIGYTGGNVAVTAGAGISGTGGNVTVTSGSTTTGTAGNAVIKGGASSSTGIGGSVVIAPGASTSGTSGSVDIQDKALTTLIQVGPTVNTIGFFGAAPIAIPTVTGAKVDLTATGALASLLAQLATLGLIIDSST